MLGVRLEVLDSLVILCDNQKKRVVHQVFRLKELGVCLHLSKELTQLIFLPGCKLNNLVEVLEVLIFEELQVPPHLIIEVLHHLLLLLW